MSVKGVMTWEVLFLFAVLLECTSLMHRKDWWQRLDSLWLLAAVFLLVAPGSDLLFSKKKQNDC